jgi:hypothetical protein
MTARYFSEAMQEEFEMAFSCSRYRPVTAVGGERRSGYRGRWHRRLIHLPTGAFKQAEIRCAPGRFADNHRFHRRSYSPITTRAHERE